MAGRKIYCAGLALALSLQTLSARATVYQGIVTNATVANGMFYVYISNGSFGGGQGNCPISNGMVYSVAVSPSASDLSKTLVALAVSAKITGMLVYASGDNNCTNGNPYNGGGSEGLVYLDLKG